MLHFNFEKYPDTHRQCVRKPSFEAVVKALISNLEITAIVRFSSILILGFVFTVLENLSNKAKLCRNNYKPSADVDILFKSS